MGAGRPAHAPLPRERDARLCAFNTGWNGGTRHPASCRSVHDPAFGVNVGKKILYYLDGGLLTISKRSRVV